MVCDFRESMGLFSWNLLIFEIIYLRNQIIYFKTLTKARNETWRERRETESGRREE